MKFKIRRFIYLVKLFFKDRQAYHANIEIVRRMLICEGCEAHRKIYSFCIEHDHEPKFNKAADLENLANKCLGNKWEKVGESGR